MPIKLVKYIYCIIFIKYFIYSKYNIMDISNFIEICRAYPSIWNVSSKEYRNLMTRNKTYNEIASILGRNKRKSV